jgi:GTPase
MQQRFFAQNGRPGAGRQRDGSAGTDAVVDVPPGTMIFDADSNELLLDMTRTGDRTVLLSGGRGGKGNTHFKSSRHQTPRFAQPGEEGVEKRLRVELRIIADIGFVGLPNAGKSTLLKVLTAANPKIGNYPFTTVIPNLGVMHHYERDIVLADIPGIIAGAHTGLGLGIQFLKHIARTRGLVFLVDATDDDPDDTLNTLQTELSSYSRELAEKPRIVVVSKGDLLGAGEGDVEKVDAFVQRVNGMVISAVTATGMDQLKGALFHLVQSAADPEDDNREAR